MALLSDEVCPRSKEIECLERYLELVPPDPRDIEVSKLALGMLYVEEGRLSEAINILQAVELEDAESQKRITLGRAFLAAEQYEMAVEQLKPVSVLRAKKDASDKQEAKYWLGVTYAESGKNSLAKKHLGAVYSSDANYRDVSRYANEMGFAVL